jgi:hypothetical protein
MLPVQECHRSGNDRRCYHFPVAGLAIGDASGPVTGASHQHDMADTGPVTGVET